MSDSAQVSIDQVAVAQLIETKKRSSLARRVGSSFVLFAVVLTFAVAAPELIGGEPWPGLEPFSIRVMVGLMVALALAVWTAWRTWRSFAGATVEDVSDSIRNEWEKATGPGWPLRVFVGGFAMGIAIGVPVGLLLALGEPVSDLPGQSRVIAVLAFVVLTLVWTVPLAYGIRMLAIRSYGKYIETS